MIPSDPFPEANRTIQPAPGTEFQVMPARAYVGEAVGGSCDGWPIIVLSYHPTPEELQEILAGRPIYLTCLGGLPPHYLSTDFQLATHPA